jgi:hypothetical protein
LEWTRLNGQALELLLNLILFGIGTMLTLKARAIQVLMAWDSHRNTIKKFADEAINIMSEVEGLCEMDPEKDLNLFWAKYNRCLVQLSSLRDRGKLVLPNRYPKKYGPNRSSAYKGMRQASLDCLTAAYYIAASINYKTSGNNRLKTSLEDEAIVNNEQLIKLKSALCKLPENFILKGFQDKGWSCKAAIVETKRQFVSECQVLIDPKLWNSNIEKLSEKVPEPSPEKTDS